ncbi:hypothetical protein [Alishewanella jeotgali]|uniref:HK97 gp10 family phage protein n=1 Tax=Alishewanella jeotgali KCTC 22429 TaxID=1129374 RepID=H3Z9N3_9ALTE|nr:hypothetical protein [Alishewanella jeotgali]EHR42734.1 hypothetical protein AJE_00170 [Alishewanella jeotgali KCTC 22429]
MKVEIALQGFAELAALWQQAPELVQREMEAAAEESAAMIQTAVVERTPQGVGAGSGLSGSILAQPVTFFEGDVVSVVGTSSTYAVPVELGTKPHFPWDKSLPFGLTPLVEWVEHKLGYTDEKAVSVAYAIAVTISRKGTEGKFMFRDGFKASEPYIKQRFGRALAQIKQELSAL